MGVTNFLRGRGEFCLLEPVRVGPDGSVIGYRPMLQRELPDLHSEFFTDCLSLAFHGPFDSFAAGAGAVLATGTWGVDATERAVGVWQMNTGSTNVGLAGFRTQPSAILFGSCGEALFSARAMVLNLATAGDDYVVRFGFGDAFETNVGAVDGAYFRYSRASSAFWECITVSNGVATLTVTNVPVVAGVFSVFDVKVSGDGAVCDFFIDGVWKARHTTNIPTAAGRHTGVGGHIQKTAGVGNLIFVVDWILGRFWRGDER